MAYNRTHKYKKPFHKNRDNKPFVKKEFEPKPQGLQVIVRNNDIQKALEFFVQKPTQGIEMGIRARSYAETMFSPNKYTDMLLTFIDNVRVTSAYDPVLHSVTDRLFGLDIKPNSASSEIILQALEGMAPVERRSNDNDDSKNKPILKPVKATI